MTGRFPPRAMAAFNWLIILSSHELVHGKFVLATPLKETELLHKRQANVRYKIKKNTTRNNIIMYIYIYTYIFMVMFS